MAIKERWLKSRVRRFAKKCFLLTRPGMLINRRLRQAKQIEESGFVLPYIEMRITTRCNMRCKRCGHLISRYGSRAKDLTFDQFKEQFDNLINAVSYINIFSLVGGETMISSHIMEILQYVMDCEKIGEIRVISNAKILPSERLLNLISGTRVCLHFSVYPQNRSNHPKIKELCKQHNIGYRFYDNYDDKNFWFDFGEVKKRRHTKRELIYMSYDCLLGISKQYCNGMLYLCPRISNAHELGLLELPPEEQLRITNDVEETRRNLLKLHTMPFSHGCRYCNAIHARRIPPAEQID